MPMPKAVLPSALCSVVCEPRFFGMPAAHAVDAEVRLYDRLFASEDPSDEGRDPLTDLNPDSLEIVRGAKVEPALAQASSSQRFQFERQGYFSVDPDSQPGAPIFNRTVTLKDAWAKIAARS